MRTLTTTKLIVLPKSEIILNDVDDNILPATSMEAMLILSERGKGQGWKQGQINNPMSAIELVVIGGSESGRSQSVEATTVGSMKKEGKGQEREAQILCRQLLHLLQFRRGNKLQHKDV